VNNNSNYEVLHKLFDAAKHDDDVRRLVDLIGADRVISVAIKHVEDKKARAAKEFETAVQRANAAHASAGALTKRSGQ
jgi:c-di-GMP-related signal transduction protein